MGILDTPSHSEPGINHYDHIARQIAERGWSETEQFVPPLVTAQLRNELQRRRHNGEFRHASVGRGKTFAVNPDIRTDQVCWLDADDNGAVLGKYRAELEQMRQCLNQSLQLGLFEFECHMAIYRAGSYYRKHLDQFRGIAERTLSVILYLNENWRNDQGGQLRIYTCAEDENVYHDILPESGKLVTFLSKRFLHEVLPATQDRMSITGWFSVRK